LPVIAVCVGYDNGNITGKMLDVRRAGFKLWHPGITLMYRGYKYQN
jgi:hypothetical protein